MMYRAVTCTLALLVAAAGAFPQQASPAPLIRRQGTATLHDVPEIPPQVTAAVQRYQNYRAASFQDWLSDGSILIATRFGASQQLHRVTMPNGARTQLTFFDEPVAGALAVPGAQRFIFGRDSGGDEWFQLYLAGLDGEPLLLTEPGTRNQSPTLSKDGKLLVWSRASKGSSDYALLARRLGEAQPARVVHQAQGAITPADLSPDATRLAFTRDISNRESQLFVLDLATGALERIAADATGLYLSPRFTADGRSLIAISSHARDVQRLVRLPLGGGRPSVLTPELAWDVEAFALSHDGHTIAYAVNEDGYSRLVLEDLATGQPLPQPELPRGVLTSLAFSPHDERLAFDLSTATAASDVWTWEVRGGVLTRWTASELGGLDAAQLIEPQLVRFRSFDGLSIPAFVYRPRAAPSQARRAVIIDIHGGPEAQSRPAFNVGAQYFAQVLGAAVILPNVRGSSGYGRRYLDLDNAQRREDSVKDIGALLDWIAAQPDLDPRRVAVYGQSYGGYMSLAVMTHYAARLVGGVERYGISDFASFLERTEAYRRDNRRAEYGDERDARMREVFARISPLANVARIGKPMLVMQGANDPRVPQSESDQVVAGIRRNNVEVWYVVFADEGHGFLKKHNNDLRREVETVFLKMLFAGS